MPLVVAVGGAIVNIPLNALLIFAVMSAIGATLTLPGIAGFVRTRLTCVNNTTGASVAVSTAIQSPSAARCSISPTAARSLAVTSAWENMDAAARTADPDAGATLIVTLDVDIEPRFEPALHL